MVNYMLVYCVIIGYIIIACIIVLLAIYNVDKTQNIKLIIDDVLFCSFVGLIPIMNLMMLYFLCDKLLENHSNFYKEYKNNQNFYK